MRRFEGNLSGHASGSQIGLRIEQYEYCDHSSIGLFVHAILDFEPLELIEMSGELYYPLQKET
jgi:hypothetical protein